MKLLKTTPLLFCLVLLSSCAYRLTVSSEDLKNTGRQIFNGERVTFHEARLTIINQTGADCYVDFDGETFMCANGEKLKYSLPYAGFIGDNKQVVINVVAIAVRYPDVKAAIKSWSVSGWRYESNNETWILEYSRGALYFRGSRY
jgi:hypothetical protein